jgi:plastocyanin
LRKFSALAFVLVAAAVGTSTAAAGTSPTVKVADDHFKPGKVTVTKNSTVVWTWKGKHRHSVTEIADKFGSKVKRKGSYKHKFAKKGKFTIYCKVHPIDMRMKVVVK